ncbi:MAG: xylulokinase [Rhodospirillales bacterium]|nr:xylulokinase [Rhodospirillales bacterium]
MYLGIDIGTSAVKSLLVDPDQNPIARSEAPVATDRPQSMWSEQDPQSWLEAVEAALLDIRASAPKAYSAVRAIGLSGQMHSALAIDATDRPIRPAILWNDGRAHKECETLTTAVPGLPRDTGVIAMPGFSAPKFLWLKEHEPEAFRRIASVLMAKDYVRLWLTGEKATDMADAAGALFLDEASRDWHAQIIQACGLSEKHLPRLLEGTGNSGTLRPDIAQRLGLRSSVIVAAGGGDAAVGAVGVGAVNAGDGFIALGTSSQFLVVQDSYTPSPENLLHTFAHCIPGKWYQMAAMLNGASCLAWAAGLLGEADIGALLARVEQSYDRPGLLLFLPYLAGERTPHNDPYARAVFFGLEPGTSPEDLVRAVLEGVVYSLMDGRACLSDTGTICDRPAIIGGGAKRRFWARMIASALDIPIARYRGAELGPAFGAARLARIADTGEAVSDICTTPEVLEIIDPEPRWTSVYQEGHARFRALYRCVAEEFRT